MPRWTVEQQEAIDKEGSNIIVSAGAGSGKTAVLTALQTIEVQETPMPDIKPDEVLVKMEYCGVCGSDVVIVNSVVKGATMYAQACDSCHLHRIMVCSVNM